jgi:hypothetical protein
MHTRSSAPRLASVRRWIGPIALTGIVLLAGCSSDVGSSKLKNIPKGAHRAEVVAAMGTGPLVATSPSDAPRIVNGFRRQMYLTGGETYEIIWYRDQPGALADPITKAVETPVVVQGDTLLLWGWSKYTPFAAKLNLPDPTHDQARADSILRAQNPTKK